MRPEYSILRIAAAAGCFVAGLLAGFSLPAAAQGFCLPHKMMSEALGKAPLFEQRFGRATAGDSLVEFYVNWTTRSWTVVGIRADKTACLIAGGQDFELDRAPPPARPET